MTRRGGSAHLSAPTPCHVGIRTVPACNCCWRVCKSRDSTYGEVIDDGAHADAASR